MSDAENWRIHTTNVTAFSVSQSLTTMPAFVRAVKVDGQELAVAPVVFARANVTSRLTLRQDATGRWYAQPVPLQNPMQKRPGLQGPIDDAFMDSFLIVRPTGRAQNTPIGAWVSAALAKATNDWRAQFRGDARVKDDLQVTDADIAAHHLVLFGDLQSNRLLARLADKLPIAWTADSVRVGDEKFAAAAHVPVFIFPNPINPLRYVVVNSGFTFAAAGSGSNAQQTPKLPDYAVLDVEQGGSVVLADFFDEQWKLR